MGYIFTLLYILVALVTPGIFPEAITDLHMAQILGWIVIVSCLATIGGAKLGTLPESYLVLGIVFAMAVSSVLVGGVHYMLGITPEYLPIILVFYFILISCRTLRRLQGVIYVLMFVALFIFANAAYAVLTDTSSPYVLRLDAYPDRWQGLGFLNDPNDTGQLFVTVIPLFWLRWRSDHHVANFFLTLLPAAILASGIYFTHSRGAVVALIAVVLFAFKDKIGLVRSAVLAGLVLVGVMALDISGGRSMGDDDGRIPLWSKALQATKAHPIFGIGIGNFGDWDEHTLSAHNSYLLCVAEMGLFGYFFWMGTIVSSWTGLTRVIVDSEREEEAFPNVRATTTSPHQPKKVLPMQPWIAAPALNRPAGPAAANPMIAQRFQYAAAGNQGSEAWMPPAVRFASSSVKEDEPDEEHRRLILAAKLFRISFVGLLASSCFLSRTFAMVFFIMLGMSAALHMIIQTGRPEQALDWKTISKRTGIVMGSSILILYLFVRIHGLH
jgi:O-antigen ligase